MQLFYSKKLANKTSTPNKPETKKGKGKKSAYLADSSLSINETAAERFTRLIGLLPEQRDRSGSKEANCSAQSGRSDPEASTSKEYGVEMNPTWYQQQGAEYRRLQEKHASKKKDEKESSLVSAMREKTKALEKMADAMQQESVGSGEGSNVDSADQLWANSLVPQMGRMTDEVRDHFMHTVFGMALKAIKGTWPPKPV